jgi:hypothetical protein
LRRPDGRGDARLAPSRLIRRAGGTPRRRPGGERGDPG